MDFKNKVIIIPDAKYFANDEKEDAHIGKLNINNYYKFNKTLELNSLENEIIMIIPELVLYELIVQHMTTLKIKSKEYFKELKIKYLDNSKNIVKINPDKKHLFKIIFQRALDKTAPFTKKSDNGFKDTILFLSLLEFCKNNSFKKCIIVSNNSNFVDKKQKLQEEFSEYCKIDEHLLDIMYKKDFNSWLNEEYGAYAD